MNSTDKENEWREEFEKYFNKKWNESTFCNRPYSEWIENEALERIKLYESSGYLEACRARQVEIDRLVKSRQLEIDRLVSICNSAVDGRMKFRQAYHDKIKEVELLKAELEKSKEELKLRPSILEHENLDQYTKSKCIELEKCQAELEKARELIRDILKYETICSPDRYLLAEELLETKEGK